MKKRLQKHLLFLQRQIRYQDQFIEQVSIVLEKMVKDLAYSKLYRANLRDIEQTLLETGEIPFDEPKVLLHENPIPDGVL